MFDFFDSFGGSGSSGSSSSTFSSNSGESFSFDYGEIFARISKEADVLVLCGDLTDLGLPEEAKILARHLSACAIPAIGVLGNHDFHSGRIEEVKKILSAANLFFLDEDRNFEINNLGFAGVKGFGGGFDEHILSFFGEKGIKDFVSEALNESLKLENSLRTLIRQFIKGIKGIGDKV